MSGHKTMERTHVRKSMSQRGEILMHLKERGAKRLVLSFVLGFCLALARHFFRAAVAVGAR